MATRAFLLCGDEKAVQAVTQILDELEVSFEHSSEPAFSLKRLATQRFDLLIVDCDNVQNATQVFNSARASNLNKTSIAIAIVEGKAGVPNAFRLGASLVLTKPVSLEQARNTLRTGIGMTRKDAQEVKAAAPAGPAIAAPTVTVTPVATPSVIPPAISAPVLPVVTPAVPAPVAPSATVAPAPFAPTARVETPKPAISAAPVAEKPALVPRPVSAPAASMQEAEPAPSSFTTAKAEPAVGKPAVAKAAAAAASASPAPAKNFDSVFATPAVTGKDLSSKTTSQKSALGEIGELDRPKLSISDPLAEEDDVLDPLKDHGVPSFGGLGKQSFAGFEKPERSRSGKGLLITAVLLVVVAGSAYGAWMTQPGFRKFVAWEYLNTMTKIGVLRGQPQVAETKPATPPQAVPVQTSSQAAPAPAVPATDPTAAAVADQGATAGSTLTPASGAPAAAQPATLSAADSTAPKAASVQPAKQDTTPNHPANSASLVAASASLPPTTAAKTPSSDLLEVPEDYADDQVLRRVHPTYPKQARARKLHGMVVLQAIVNKQGKVNSLQLVSGDPLLAQAAADAVKQWRYKPYWHNGEPVDFQTRVTVDFKLP